MTVAAEQNVLGLEIAIDHLLGVQVRQRDDDLGEEESASVLVETAMPLEAEEQVATAGVGERKVHLVNVLESEVEGNDEGVAERLHTRCTHRARGRITSTTWSHHINHVRAALGPPPPCVLRVARHRHARGASHVVHTRTPA